MITESHAERMQRARLALDGVSVGDAFGERFFSVHVPLTPERIAQNEAPAPPWKYTDDTEMALAIFEVLERNGHIDQDDLAESFAARYDYDPNRGYGQGAAALLSGLNDGLPWHWLAPALFDGQGSYGNGGAMRVAPVGAYFSDHVERLVVEARRSADVTHAHSEGQAGAIAVAVAAAFAWNNRGRAAVEAGPALLEFAWTHTPKGDTRDGIERARGLSATASVREAVELLGNGTKVSAQDTVPFTLWCAARHFGDYQSALWQTVSGLGDRDTTCAIVGGIVALSGPEGGIPPDWLKAREPLRFDRPPRPAAAG